MIDQHMQRSETHIQAVLR